MSARVFSPFLMLLARLTDPELTRAVQFLKEENKVLRSRLGKKVQVTPPERRRLLKVAEPLGDAIKELITIVTYRTFLRWKSDAKKKGKKAKKEKRKRGRPRTPAEIREIVLRIARETGWGYTRILGELKKLRIKLSRNTVKNILKENGLDPGPKRGLGTWDEFLKIHRLTLWAVDFLTKEVWTLTGRLTFYILFFVEVHTRRVVISGMTPSPNGPWMAQQARNMRMLFEEEGKEVSYIIKDADTKFTAQFDAILESNGATVKQISRKAPNMNPFCEAWIGTFKRECLDRFIVFGERHLDHLCRTYERYYNSVRAHSSLGNNPVAVEEALAAESVEENGGVICESWLGGMLRHYRRAAA